MLQACRATGNRALTIARHVRASAHAPAAPRAAWLARASDQRPHLPRHLAARRLPAPARGVHGHAPDAAAAPEPAAGVRHASAPCGSRPTWRARTRTARPRPRARPARLRGSPTSCGRTDSSSDRTRSRPTVAGRGRLHFVNLVAVVPGRSPRRSSSLPIVTTAASDAGANDNASGTAALIELARSYANPAAASTAPSTSRRVRPAHTIVFLSTDGGALGGIGAAHFAKHSPLARDVVAVINLDAIAGPGRARLEFSGDTPRMPSTGLLATAAARMLEQGRDVAQRPSALRQLLDLAFPFSFYEQAPFLAQGISARDAHLGGRPSAEPGRRHARPAEEPRPPARQHRTRVAAVARLARRGPRARAGNVDVRLLRCSHRPRLGDRDRPRRRAASLSRRPWSTSSP